MTIQLSANTLSQTGNELIAQMMAGLSANSWYITCSYALAPINAALPEKHENDKLVDQLKLTVKGDSPLGENFAIDHDLMPGAPELIFRWCSPDRYVHEHRRCEE